MSRRVTTSTRNGLPTKKRERPIDILLTEEKSASLYTGNETQENNPFFILFFFSSQSPTKSMVFIFKPSCFSSFFLLVSQGKKKKIPWESCVGRTVSFSSLVVLFLLHPFCSLSSWNPSLPRESPSSSSFSVFLFTLPSLLPQTLSLLHLQLQSFSSQSFHFSNLLPSSLPHFMQNTSWAKSWRRSWIPREYTLCLSSFLLCTVSDTDQRKREKEGCIWWWRKKGIGCLEGSWRLQTRK